MEDISQERFSRFGNNRKNMFYPKGHTRPVEAVTAALFLPRPEAKEVSAFQTTGWNDDEIWCAGNYVYMRAQQKLVGRGDVLGQDLQKLSEEFDSLGIRPDPLQKGEDGIEPPPGHVNIVGFTDNKDFNDLLANKLAEIARVVVYLSST